MREIFSSPQFEKKLLKFLKKNPELEEKITKIFIALQRDIHHPLLKTHKLHGTLSSSYACTIAYEYRLVFSFDGKYVYLHSIGTHDEVY